MTYATVDVSTQSAEVVYYHEFVTQLGVYRYNTSSAIRTLNGASWLPLPIKHTIVSQSGETDKNSLTVTLPRSTANDMNVDFDAVVPKGTYTMFRGFLTGTGETVVNWKGKIASRRRTQTDFILAIESLATSVKRHALSDRVSVICRHSVYNRGCNLSRASFQTSGTVTDLSEKTATVSAASGETDGYFNGGIMELPDGDEVMIVSHTGSSLVLDQIPDYLKLYLDSSGVSVDIYPGCDKLESTCINVFNNLPNNGGFKYIPDRNPFSGGSAI